MDLPYAVATITSYPRFSLEIAILPYGFQSKKNNDGVTVQELTNHVIASLSEAISKDRHGYCGSLAMTISLITRGRLHDGLVFLLTASGDKAAGNICKRGRAGSGSIFIIAWCFIYFLGSPWIPGDRYIFCFPRTGRNGLLAPAAVWSQNIPANGFRAETGK